MHKISKFGLDPEDTYELARGRLYFEKCNSCDNNGKVYYDGETGQGVSKSPSGINPENLEIDSCDECNGYGYFLKRREN